MSLIDTIFEEMENDDEDRDEQSEILMQIWEESSPEVRAVINNVLICLCGWSMPTLLEKIAA